MKSRNIKIKLFTISIILCFSFAVSGGKGGGGGATVTAAPITVSLVRPGQSEVSINPLPECSPDTGLTITKVGNPSSGSVTSNGTTIIYTPDENFVNGEDSFSYTVEDDSKNKDSADITVNVSGPEAPTASDVSVTLTRPDEISKDISPLSQCTPETGLTITDLGRTRDGTASITDAGTTITYTPNEDFIEGSETFSYTVEDAYGRDSTADITVNVSGPEAPTASDVTVTLTRPDEISKVISPLSQCTPETGLTITDLGRTRDGTASITDAGTTITYTPNEDFIEGSETFSYTVEDAYGRDSSGNITVTVSTAPVANDDTITTEKDVSATISPLANDTGTEISLQSVSSPTTRGGTAVVSGDSIEYTPPENFTGTDTFTYTIIDTDEQTATGTIIANVYESGGLDEAITKKIIDGTDEEAYAIYANAGSPVEISSSEATNKDYLPAIEFLQFEQVYTRYAQSDLNTAEEKGHFQETANLFDQLHDLRHQMEDGDTSQATIDEFNSKMVDLITYISP